MLRINKPVRIGAIVLTAIAVVAAVFLINLHASAGNSAPHTAQSAPDLAFLEHQAAVQHPAQLQASLAQVARMPVGHLPAMHGTKLPTGNWQPIGPAPESYFNAPFYYSGPVDAIAIDPTTSGSTTTIYIGAFDGGVWKSTNNGSTWTPLTDRQNDNFISAVALDPTNHNTVYAANSYGILKSTDAGATWTLTGGATVAGAQKIIVNPRNAQQVFALTIGFLYETVNGGSTWTQVAGGLPGNGLVTDVAIDLYPTATVLFATVDQAGVYRSTNAGTSWIRLGGGLPAAANWGSAGVAVAPSNPNIVYTVTTNFSGQVYVPGSFNGGYYSTNAGGNWHTMPSLNINFTTYDNPLQPFLPAVPLLSVDPKNDNLLYGIGSDLAVSTNARGTSGDWTNITNTSSTTPNEHLLANQGGIAFPACTTAPCPVFLANAGGVYASYNTTVTPGVNVFYTSLNAGGLQIASMSGGAASAGPLIGTSGWTNPSRTFGSHTWEEMVFGSPMDSAIAQPTSTMYLSQNQLLIRSTDSGGYWGSGMGSGSGTLPRGVTRFAVDPKLGTHLIVADGTAVYETLDGANHWYRLSQTMPTSVLSVGISANNHVEYAMLSDGSVWRTTTSATGKASTFVKMGTEPLLYGTSSRHFYPLSVDPVDTTGNTIYGSSFDTINSGGKYTEKEAFAMSTDGGAHWTMIGGHLPDYAFVHSSLVYYVGSTRVILAGTYLGVFMTTNNGATWAKLSNGLPNTSISKIAFGSGGTSLVAFTLGRGVWSVPLN